MPVDFEIYKNLIVADDDPDDQLMLKEIISEYSSLIKTTCISDGKKLMEHLTVEKPPDLLLLDLNMPYKSGIQCLNEIRADKKLRALPIVVFSTSRNMQDIELCFSGGAHLFYSKPWDLKSCRALIHSILEIDWSVFKRPNNPVEFSKVALEGRLLN
ncbi:MAG TPA: response regulator [Bacteroidia bacterium]|jgi:CheY-like chemotaxis protein